MAPHKAHELDGKRRHPGDGWMRKMIEEFAEAPRRRQHETAGAGARSSERRP